MQTAGYEANGDLCHLCPPPHSDHMECVCVGLQWLRTRNACLSPPRVRVLRRLSAVPRWTCEARPERDPSRAALLQELLFQTCYVCWNVSKQVRFAKNPHNCPPTPSFKRKQPNKLGRYQEKVFGLQIQTVLKATLYV